MKNLHISTGNASRSALCTLKEAAHSATFRPYRSHAGLYEQLRFYRIRPVSTRFLIRFSTVIGSKGSPDTDRDPRGFAVKFYTSQGNYDVVGLSLPVFFIRDAMQFPDFIHSQKPDPCTNIKNYAHVWDFSPSHRKAFIN